MPPLPSGCHLHTPTPAVSSWSIHRLAQPPWPTQRCRKLPDAPSVAPTHSTHGGVVGRPESLDGLLCAKFTSSVPGLREHVVIPVRDQRVAVAGIVIALQSLRTKIEPAQFFLNSPRNCTVKHQAPVCRIEYVAFAPPERRLRKTTPNPPDRHPTRSQE